MNKKLYFSELEEDYARSIKYLLDEMGDRELQEIRVWQAVRELKSDYFYCKSAGEVSEKQLSEPCGKICQDYEPRNGKSGCCKSRGFCYGPGGKEFILRRDGKLMPKLFNNG